MWVILFAVAVGGAQSPTDTLYLSVQDHLVALEYHSREINQAISYLDGLGAVERVTLRVDGTIPYRVVEEVLEQGLKSGVHHVALEEAGAGSPTVVGVTLSARASREMLTHMGTRLRTVGSVRLQVGRRVSYREVVELQRALVQAGVKGVRVDIAVPRKAPR